MLRSTARILRLLPALLHQLQGLLQLLVGALFRRHTLLHLVFLDGSTRGGCASGFHATGNQQRRAYQATRSRSKTTSHGNLLKQIVLAA